MRGTLHALLLFIMAAAVAGCTSTQGAPLKPVQQVDLQRYMGDWHVIANIPYFAERNCFDSIESYALRADGRIDNWFQCRKGSFDAPLKRKVNAVATVEDPRSNAVWRVRFFKVISAQYFILELDPNYQWVMVGHPSRRYGWIMARGKTLDEPVYRDILSRTAEHGYDPSRFQMVPQQP